MKWTSKYREVKTRGRKGQEVGGVTPRKRVTLLFFFWGGGGGGEILERAEGKKKSLALSVFLSLCHRKRKRQKADHLAPSHQLLPRATIRPQLRSMRSTRCGVRDLPLVAAGRARTHRLAAPSTPSTKKKANTTLAPPPLRRRLLLSTAAATATTSSFETATAAETAAAAVPPSRFNWAQQWYPVLCAVTTDSSRPHACQVSADFSFRFLVS